MNKKTLENHWHEKFKLAAQKNRRENDYKISLWKKEALEAYIKYFLIYFQPQIKKDNSKTLVLDIGCGPGTFSNLLAKRGFLVQGIDVVPEAIDIAKERSANQKINYQVGNIYSLPFPDKNFDIIICLGVFQTLDNEKAALKEIKKKLKPSGLLIITTLNRFSLFSALNIRKEFPPKRFGPFSFKKFLASENFKEIKIKGIYFFPEKISLFTKIIIKLGLYKFFNLFFFIFNIFSHSFYIEAKNS